ncbi:hypothetical protein NQ117_09540 [Paenibacillus sp. SC116]|uniref:hypothetical protein n=1 Tax=Paenibacillus sp. SC116 TaxID=2968986 RepID=UPI00215AA02F|nr:hypothetical protein [Paenibacillus sp. SC116]MCR8843930.1 hypothetical protein [Paenibacillus sp. SC116]
MYRWVDVSEGDWFYHEVVEASNTLLEDGQPLVGGIPYSSFMADAPYLYDEQTAPANQKMYTLDKKVVPTKANPLLIYIDGVQTTYKEAKTNATGTKTDVELYVAPRKGALISFMILGKPLVDHFGKPNLNTNYAYPKKTLDHPYVYDPFNRKFQEYVYAFGKQLRRAQVPPEAESKLAEAQIAAKYIGDKQDTYWISEDRNIFLPYNLNGVTCTMQYASKDKENNISLRRETIRASSQTGNIRFNNRFFPDAYITRAEAFALIDRLRKQLYSKFTDIDAPVSSYKEIMIAEPGQRFFKLNTRYVPGSGMLKVYVDDKEVAVGTDYEEFDDHSICFLLPVTQGKPVRFELTKTTSSRFVDVAANASMYIAPENRFEKYDSTADTWWCKHVMDMEEEKIGTNYLIEGMRTTSFNQGAVVVDKFYNPGEGKQTAEIRFMPQTLLTRAQAVTFLNRFRKWSIERFKR